MQRNEVIFNIREYTNGNHVKIYSTSLSIREIEIKTIMRYHYTLLKQPTLIKKDSIKYLQGCRETRSPLHCSWECKIIQAL